MLCNIFRYLAPLWSYSGFSDMLCVEKVLCRLTEQIFFFPYYFVHNLSRSNIKCLRMIRNNFIFTIIIKEWTVKKKKKKKKARIE